MSRSECLSRHGSGNRNGKADESAPQADEGRLSLREQ